MSARSTSCGKISSASFENLPEFFILLALFLAVVGFLAGTLIIKNLMLAVLLMFVLGAFPFLYLLILKQKRTEKFKRQLPEALDLMSRALKAGHAFTNGLKLAADEFDDPLGPEFSEAIDEINFGVSVPDALRNLTKRIDCPEIRYFVVGVILQRETGGNLSELMGILALLIREKFKFQGKVRTLSAEGRLSAFILILLPFLIAGWLRFSNPKYLAPLLTDPIGKVLLMGAPEKPEDSSTRRVRFLKAGIRHNKSGAIFWGIKCFLLVLFFLTFLTLRISVFKIMSGQLTIALGVLIPFLGFYLPDIWLRQKTDKRKDKLLKALPDALDLLVVCVEAGMGLDEAINRVAREIKLQSPDLSEELSFLSLELRAGKVRQAALRNLAVRTNLEEVSNLVTLLIQADKFGTSIADTLRVYSDSFRTERFQRAEEIAAKMPVKLIFPLILFIFPSLFLVIVGPAIISIYRNFILRF